MAEINLRLRRVNWTQVRRQLKDLAPLLASLLLAIALGSYLYRNAGPLGLNKNNEQLVPVGPVHDVPLTETSSYTSYPQSRDYYMNEHIPHRVDNLESKANELKERARSGMRSASDSLASAADSIKDQASNARDWISEKSTDLSSQASDLSDRARINAAELKDQMKDQTAHWQHRAKTHSHHAQRQAQYHMKQGERKWEQAKDQAGDWMESAKGKFQDWKDSASDMAQQAKSKITDAADQTKESMKSSYAQTAAMPSSSQSGQPIYHRHDQHSIREDSPSQSASQSPAGVGPYDEVNTPPHSHTYPHTLGGAAEFMKDKLGEGLRGLGKQAGQAQMPTEPLR